MKKNVSQKVLEIKAAIKNGTYDWEKAIANAADKILAHPESLLWQ